MHSLCIKVVKSCKEVCKLQFLWKLYTGGGIWILSYMILSIFSCICEGLRIQWTLDVTNTGRGLNVTPIAGEWCPASSCPFHWQRTWVGKKYLAANEVMQHAPRFLLWEGVGVLTLVVPNVFLSIFPIAPHFMPPPESKEECHLQLTSIFFL